MPDFTLEGEFEAMREVQAKEEERLLDTPNVVGVGLGHKETKGVDTGKPCLSVFVSQKLERELLARDEVVKKQVGGIETDVIETGDIFAATAAPGPSAVSARFARGTKYPAQAPPTEAADGAMETLAPSVPETDVLEEIGIELLRGRVRPAKGGYSVGHFRVTAGTIATAAYDAQPFPQIPPRYYLLSNNHVLANSNDAQIGDPILQPGRVDGGRVPADVIARLSRFVPLRFATPPLWPPNLVDAAIAEAPFHLIDREIFWIGYVQGSRHLTSIGELVRKTGRTTNYTTGRVTNVNATVNVNYGGGRVARMVRQIVTTNMSAPGDSGSLLCDMQGNAVGLLFAGSATRTIHNHILFVQRLLGVRLI